MSTMKKLGLNFGIKDNKLYRYESVFYSFVDEWDDFHRNFSPTLEIYEYVVYKETKCGVWITDKFDLWKARQNTNEHGHYFKKFVNMNSRKKFANITPDKALHDFIKRKERQIEILKNNLDDAEKSLHEGKIQSGEIKPVDKVEQLLSKVR